MIKNYWYAVEFAHELVDAPISVELMGQQLVIWRDSKGTPRAQSDICIHRGGPLSGGSVRDGCIECPYHGWQYDSDGRCVSIPANRDGVPIPKKARIDTYPAAERYGFIFIFLGDLPKEKRPPLPYIKELDQSGPAGAAGFRTITGEFTWRANYERVLENGVDIAHAPFVHSGSFGNRDKPEVEEYTVDEIVHNDAVVGNICSVHLDPPAPSGIWSLVAKKNKERPPILTRTGVFFPNVTMLEVNLPLGSIRIVSAVVPVNATKSITKWTMMRDFFPGRWADRDSRRRTMKIFYEDQATVEGQRPELVPMDLAAELHVKSDSNQLAYRRWRQAGVERGWQIPEPTADAVAQSQIKVVPSPARRESPELENAWVIKEMEQS